MAFTWRSHGFHMQGGMWRNFIGLAVRGVRLVRKSLPSLLGMFLDLPEFESSQVKRWGCFASVRLCLVRFLRFDSHARESAVFFACVCVSLVPLSSVCVLFESVCGLV